MGKMNRIVEPLSNGDKGRDCEVEGWCGAPAYQLSSSERRIGTNVENPAIQRFSLIVRYKCSNGHRFDKQFTKDKDLLAAPK